MGKQKISITIDSILAEKIEKFLKDGRFRNRSHVLEYGLKKLMEVEE
ncbi:MAG: ribbon-helix-helix domain-containing protein [archaeon]